MRRFALATLVALSLAGFAGESVAQESVSQTAQVNQSMAESLFEKGMAAHKKHNEDEALQYFKKAAELGHADSQFIHGSHLLDLRRNKEAQQWMVKAAKNGSVLAQTTVGESFLKGDDGFEKNPEKGIYWLTKAANNNWPKAQHLLGMAYLDGNGVKKDQGEAVKWLTKSSEQNFSPAQLKLSQLYASGTGVKKDIDKSAKLLIKAAENNDPDALTLQGKYLFAADHYQSSFKSFEKAATLGNSEAQYFLGIMYRSGIGVKQDIEKSNELLNESALNGEANAQYQLFLLYFNGDGLPKNKKKALIWLERASNQNHLKAQVTYAHQLWVDKKYHQTFQVLQKAVKNKGDPEMLANAQFLIGDLYMSGSGTRQNFAEGFKWTQKAAIAGQMHAQAALGEMYEKGWGTKQNLKLAKSWYGKACDNGYQDGCDSYRRLNERGL